MSDQLQESLNNLDHDHDQEDAASFQQQEDDLDEQLATRSKHMSHNISRKASINEEKLQEFFQIDEELLIHTSEVQVQEVQPCDNTEYTQESMRLHTRVQDIQETAVNLTFENETIMRSADALRTPKKQSRLNNEKELKKLEFSAVKKHPTTLLHVEVNAFTPSQNEMIVRQLTYTQAQVIQQQSRHQRSNSSKRDKTQRLTGILKPSQPTQIIDQRRAITPLSKDRQQRQLFTTGGNQQRRDTSPGISNQNKSMSSWYDNNPSERSMKKSSSQMYLSVRKNSQNKQKSIISQLHPKEQKVSIDYFLGTAKLAITQKKAKFKESIDKIIQNIQQRVPNGLEIVSNLKVIFFEHSVFVEGGTMGSSIQPINQNMMTLYLFHQFLKRYSLALDHRVSHSYEMMFLEICHKQMKKVDFLQFGAVLAKIAIKRYIDEHTMNVEDCEPIEYIVRLIHENLFSVNIEEKAAEEEEDQLQEKEKSIMSPVNVSKIEQVENEFERYRQEYENQGLIGAKTLMLKDKKMLEQIFNGYAKASKRGTKIIALRQYKWMMRDLQIIPHITTEYKCSQLFKFLDSSKKQAQAYPEEVCTFEVFPLCLYIVFSLILEDETDIKSKVNFINKWLREHSKDKMVAMHANREDTRIKYTNQKLLSTARR